MATLTVTHTESLSLDGRDRSATKTFTVSNITEIYERTLTIPHTNPTVLVSFDSSVEGSAVELPTANVKYIRITNTHASNAIELAIVSATNYQVTLAAGQTHVLGAAATCLLAEADASPSFGDMADLVSIQAQGVSASTTVEVYIASISS